MGTMPEVEDADRAIGGDGGEDADAAPRDVVHLPVVRDQLRVHDPLLRGAAALTAVSAQAAMSNAVHMPDSIIHA